MSGESAYPEMEATSVEVVSSDVMYEQNRAEIDVQVSTARAYPRNVSRCIQNAKAIVAISEAAARTCSYSLPRGGKTVTGPTIHLAKILAQQYGNMRVEAKVVAADDKNIRCQAVAWDIETNFAVRVEVMRKITDKNGKRFNDDMVTMTGNAGNAIAMRNAIFAVVPKQIVDEVYQAAQRKITGDLSDADVLNAKRVKVVNALKSAYNLKEEDVLRAIGKSSVSHINAEDIVVLTGIDQAIKDGDSDREQAFFPEKTRGEGRGAAAVTAASEAIKNAQK